MINPNKQYNNTDITGKSHSGIRFTEVNNSQNNKWITRQYI